MRHVWSGISIFALAAVSQSAFARVPVPEPGVLELAGIGAVVAIAATWFKNRRK